MIFKVCPQCGGSVVRLRDETGDKYLSCQKCTWATKTDDEVVPPPEPPTPVKIPVWLWVVTAVTFLAVLALLIFCPPK
jgi:hypothetical protein